MIRWATLAAITTAAGVVSAQQYLYLNSEQLTVGTTATSFTAGKITPSGSPSGVSATRAYCSLETANIRFTVDGLTTPTSNYGVLWTSGTSLTFVGTQTLNQFKSVAATSTSGLITCAYSNP